MFSRRKFLGLGAIALSPATALAAPAAETTACEKEIEHLCDGLFAADRARRLHSRMKLASLQGQVHNRLLKMLQGCADAAPHLYYGPLDMVIGAIVQWNVQPACLHLAETFLEMPLTGQRAAGDCRWGVVHFPAATALIHLKNPDTPARLLHRLAYEGTPLRLLLTAWVLNQTLGNKAARELVQKDLDHLMMVLKNIGITNTNPAKPRLEKLLQWLDNEASILPAVTAAPAVIKEPDALEKQIP